MNWFILSLCVFNDCIYCSREEVNSTIKFNTDKIVTGLEYLGSGYDIVKANTIGDSNQGEDIGYRAPVIEFAWAQTDVGVTNSLNWLQPIGGWIRPKISCGESENVSEIETTSNLKDLIQADVSLKAKVPNVGTAAITTGYNELINDGKDKRNKLYTNTYYCFTYAAGMPPSLDWVTTSEFKRAIKSLPVKLDECTLKMYNDKAKSCKGMERWIQLFSEFGTHIATEIHLGGKLTRFLTVPTSSINSLKEMGYNVNAAVGAALSGVDGTVSIDVKGGDKAAIDNFKRSYKLRFSVLGGIHPDKNISETSILKWKASIPKSPMPIKTVLTTIDTYLPRNYKYTYREAMDFYISLNKALPWDIELKNGNSFTLKTFMSNSVQVFGTPLDDRNIAKCPEGKRILWGFIINVREGVGVTSCIQDRTSCEYDDKNAWIWIICGNSLGLQISSYSRNFNEKEQGVFNCVDGNVILTGFKIVLMSDGSIGSFDPCKTGDDKCDVTDNGSKKSIWMICVDRRLPGLMDAETKTSVNSTITTDDKILFSGLTGCYNGVKSKAEPCNRFIKECKMINKCAYSIAWGLFI